MLEISDTDGTTLADFTAVAYIDEWELRSDETVSVVLDRLYYRVARLVTRAPQKAQSLLNGLDNLLPPEGDSLL